MRNTRKIVIALVLAALAAAVLPLCGRTANAAPVTPPEPSGSLTLTPLGTYATGVFDKAASEIVAYDLTTQRAFVTNSSTVAVDVLDMSNPISPTLITSLDVSSLGSGLTSVAVHDGVLAVAIVAKEKTDNGRIAFFTTADGNLITSVEAGALPDMVTFSPDGTKVLTANEGEPNDDYSIDPEGSVTIVDLAGGVENVTQDQVKQVSFAAFNEAALDDSIRIFGPNATVAQDLEPEYIAVSPDSTKAWVTLQENNALAVIDISAGEAITVTALGLKDWNRPQAKLQALEWADRPLLGTTAAGQEILLGGFSGLYFEGRDEATGELHFITHPDRGPNPEPVDVDGDGVNERPFALPDYQAQLVRFAVNPATAAFTITEQIMLTRADGTPISGLPNLAGEAGMAYADEEPVDLFGNALELDPYGADLEGIVVADDGTFWLVDEYRPSIYHFGADGVLIDRFVPTGSNENEAGVQVGTEALPAIYAQRRANRGFEAVAMRDGILYAFIQSPLDNPDSSKDSNSKRGHYARILAFDTKTGETVGQYLYPIGLAPVDKIGDAVALPDGTFLVIERDDATGPEAQKLIYKVDLSGATNIQGMDEAIGLEQQGLAGLGSLGIRPAAKTLYVDLAKAGYDMVAKTEGLALVDDNTLAVLNDNDFAIGTTFTTTTGLMDAPESATPVVLGLISLTNQGLDVSDKDDAINIANWPVYGMYMPDSIAAYMAGGETYLVTANEGDARDYAGYSEEKRVGDLVLDWSVFPNAAELQKDENLGRLTTTTAGTDTNGDGLVDRILTFGGRSFSIWSPDGKLVFDSGSAIEAITAAAFPDDFNADGENGSFDSRSDAKGPEPEALAIGQIGDRSYAFVGLERIGGIVVYDITDPKQPSFVTYANNRDFAGDAEAGTAGDLSPEGIVFIPAEQSPTSGPALLVANELSGSTTFWSIDVAQ
jgi:hypothetical protein